MVLYAYSQVANGSHHWAATVMLHFNPADFAAPVDGVVRRLSVASIPRPSLLSIRTRLIGA